MGKVIRPVCKNCGHADHHCPSSGCNHFDDDGWCDCEEMEPAACYEIDGNCPDYDQCRNAGRCLHTTAHRANHG